METLEGLTTKDLPPVTNPVAELATVAAKVLYFQDLMEVEVSRLHALETFDVKGTENIKAVVGAYERALERSINVLDKIARLDIDNRLVRIEEQQAEMVMVAFVATLRKMGLEPDDITRARAMLAAELEAVTV
jgi:hypothetical protein